MTLTPGDVVNYEAVRQLLQQWGERFEIREIAYNPWNANEPA